ncbi:MAG TPA: hypothetical protein VEG34_06075, partial [Thermoanaerobaculia bacterium]|nr:hypothetical protein [Thermoanaerobaculia bacterium]
ARRPVPLMPLSAAEAAGLRTLREWDDRVVAPRHGFAGAADYYQRASVGPRLGELRLPALVLAAQGDPMIPAATLRPILDRPHPGLAVRWLDRGGHVAFPRRVALEWPEIAAPTHNGTLEAHALAWLRRA